MYDIFIYIIFFFYITPKKNIQTNNIIIYCVWKQNKSKKKNDRNFVNYTKRNLTAGEFNNV